MGEPGGHIGIILWGRRRDDRRTPRWAVRWRRRGRAPTRRRRTPPAAAQESRATMPSPNYGGDEASATGSTPDNKEMAPEKAGANERRRNPPNAKMKWKEMK